MESLLPLLLVCVAVVAAVWVYAKYTQKAPGIQPGEEVLGKALAAIDKLVDLTHRKEQTAQMQQVTIGKLLDKQSPAAAEPAASPLEYDGIHFADAKQLADYKASKGIK